MLTQLVALFVHIKYPVTDKEGPQICKDFCFIYVFILQFKAEDCCRQKMTVLKGIMFQADYYYLSFKTRRD